MSRLGKIFKAIQYIAKHTRAAPNIIAVLDRFEELQRAAKWMGKLHDWKTAQAILAKGE
jgi:hypothetical protein